MVAGDLSSPSSLTAAFAGATAIFSTTDFWAAYYNPYTQSLLAQGQTLGEYCMLQELQQGRNVADAASNVVGLERIVVSSLCDVREKSGGKYGGVYHWDGKARAVKYLNEAYPALAAKLSVVLVGNYMSNWKKDVKLRKVRLLLAVFDWTELTALSRRMDHIVSDLSDQECVHFLTSMSRTI